MTIKRIIDFYQWLWKDLSFFGKCMMLPISIFIFPIIASIILCIKDDSEDEEINNKL